MGVAAVSVVSCTTDAEFVMTQTEQLTITALPGIPDVQPGDALGPMLLEAVQRAGLTLQEGDVLVIAQKIVSKAEGQFVVLAEVEPSSEAKALAAEVGKDPRKVEVILRESRRIVRAVKRPDANEGLLIAEHRLGFICANAAVDESNLGQEGALLLLPEQPDQSARLIRDALQQASGQRVGVIISDTFGRPWRMGLVNVAVGVAGVPAVVDQVGECDAFGRTLTVTNPALADELAAASGLLMSKNGRTPAILFRGLDWQEAPESSARDLLRPQQEDLFR